MSMCKPQEVESSAYTSTSLSCECLSSFGFLGYNYKHSFLYSLFIWYSLSLYLYTFPHVYSLAFVSPFFLMLRITVPIVLLANAVHT